MIYSTYYFSAPSNSLIICSNSASVIPLLRRSTMSFISSSLSFPLVSKSESLFLCWLFMRLAPDYSEILSSFLFVLSESFLSFPSDCSGEAEDELSVDAEAGFPPVAPARFVFNAEVAPVVCFADAC